MAAGRVAASPFEPPPDANSSTKEFKADIKRELSIHGQSAEYLERLLKQIQGSRKWKSFRYRSC